MQDFSSMEIYLVGGAVRDQLLGLELKERDWLVVGTKADKLLELGFKQVGTDFPVFLHPETKEEYALARTERKKGKGYKGFLTETDDISLEEDLKRRDLTINAIAQSLSGEIIDPYQGRKDLDKRLLRHVSEAFSEDPLRVLRVARFTAQLSKFDFTVCRETLLLMESMSANGELKSITPERIWLETEKALSADRPGAYFETLRQVGALKVIFPEIDTLFGTGQHAEFNLEFDGGLHCMLSLEKISKLSSDPAYRFAVLCQNLGKMTAPKGILPHNKGHAEASAKVTRSICERLKVPNLYKKLAMAVSKYHLRCHRVLYLSAEEIVDLLSKLGAWKENSLVDAFTLCCSADTREKTGLDGKEYPQRDFLLRAEKQLQVVNTEKILKAGYKEKEIGQQIKKQRVLRLSSLMEESQAQSTNNLQGRKSN